MDAKEYKRKYNKYIGIAKKLFREVSLWSWKEGMLLAEYATHVAILTHREELSSLSTYIHYVALGMRTQFVRSGRKWIGMTPGTLQSMDSKYVAINKHIQLISAKEIKYTVPEQNIGDVCVDIYAGDDCLDFQLDMQTLIETLEQKHDIFRGKLSIIVEDWIAGIPTRITADKLGCSRQWISILKQKFKEKLAIYRQL